MQFNKIIYLRYLPLTAKVYSDFYMHEAINSGVLVEYWDLTELFFKNIGPIEDSSYLTVTYKFNSYKSLQSSIALESQSSNTLFISIMSFEGRVMRLHMLLTKYNCKVAIFGRNIFPVPSSRFNIFYLFSRFTFSSIFNLISTKILLFLLRLGKINQFDIVFLGGTLGWQGIGRINIENIYRSQIVKLNSDDYDNALSLKNNICKIKGEYILFLDEYLPLHPDTFVFNISNVKVEDYYPCLCNYFDRVEKEFGVPVVIAAHPKASRYKTEDFFNGRDVYFDSTAILTKGANFVLAHDSTSINFPVIFGKKIHFITSKAIEKGINQVHLNTLYFANYLNCNFQYIDDDSEIDIVQSVSKESYDLYKYNYQTSIETEFRLSSEIFVEFINLVR